MCGLPSAAPPTSFQPGRDQRFASMWSDTHDSVSIDGFPMIRTRRRRSRRGLMIRVMARCSGRDAASCRGGTNALDNWLAATNYLDLATERAWKIALAAPIGALDRFNLLNTASLAPRVDALIEVLDDQIAVLTLASPQ